MKKKYSFDDWWEGNVCLTYSTIEYFADKIRPPVKVGWDEILKNDIEKIKTKQKELCEVKRESLFEEMKKDFEKRYENSRMKSSLLKDEKYSTWSKLTKRPSHPVSKDENVIEQYEDAIRVNNYFNQFIKGGKDRTFDFIHSPNCLYQNANKSSREIYAECCFDYYNWLKQIDGDKIWESDIKDQPRTFPQYLDYHSPDLLAIALKKYMSKKSGQDFALMREALIQMSILSIPKRGNQKFYSTLVKYFGNIGSRPSVMKKIHKEIKNIHHSAYTEAYNDIDNLLAQLKT